MKLTLLYVLIFVLFYSCKDKTSQTEKWKSEIMKTEREFSARASREGIPAAFAAYAADSVVLLRNDSLIKGMEGLIRFYNQRAASADRVTLTWEPDFADVSASGDLGYTYGKYVFTRYDSSGNSQSYTGIFHTVWKRQKNGDWKFVWD